MGLLSGLLWPRRKGPLCELFSQMPHFRERASLNQPTLLSLPPLPLPLRL